jgi:hypothetical protein
VPAQILPVTYGHTHVQYANDRDLYCGGPPVISEDGGAVPRAGLRGSPRCAGAGAGRGVAEWDATEGRSAAGTRATGATGGNGSTGPILAAWLPAPNSPRREASAAIRRAAVVAFR